MLCLYAVQAPSDPLLVTTYCSQPSSPAGIVYILSHHAKSVCVCWGGGLLGTSFSLVTKIVLFWDHIVCILVGG